MVSRTMFDMLMLSLKNHTSLGYMVKQWQNAPDINIFFIAHFFVKLAMFYLLSPINVREL